MSLRRLACLAFTLGHAALCAGAAGIPLNETIALRGPEVAKLDWNTRALQAADLDGDGLNDLLLINNDRATLEFLYQVKPGSPPIRPPRTVAANRWEPVVEDARFRKDALTTGITMFDAATGDLNGDGRLDIAYTGDPQALTVRYQQADGTWKETKLPEAPAPLQFVSGLRIADLNNDGRADLVMLGQKELAIFYQDASHQLAAPARFVLPEENCYGLELCDIDADGRTDLVYLSSAANRDSLRVRRQTPGGEFGPEQAYAIKPARSTLQVLATAKAGGTAATFAFAQSQTGQLEVFRLEQAAAEADSAAALRPRVFSPRGTAKNPASYAFGDFDGDGRDDIAVGDPDGAQVFVYSRQRDGGFTGAQRFPSFTDIRSLAAGDWDGDGRAELFVASGKEQTAGVAAFTKSGRLDYPQPLPVAGKPLAVATGTFGPRTMLVIVREEKGKRFVELWSSAGNGPAKQADFELPGLKTDPRAVRVLDANQDGRADIAIFTPFEAMRLFVQGDDAKLTFSDASAASGFRKGLVDNLDAAALSLGDLDADGRNELLISSNGFARAVRLDSKGELTVVDQLNARDTGAEISTALVLPGGRNARPSVVLYDRKTEHFQLLRPDKKDVYQVIDTAPAGKIEIVGAEVRSGGKEAFILGRDRFWWIPVGQGDYVARTASTHTTDLPQINYSDVIAGDLNADGRPDLVCIDPDKNLVELLSADATGQWQSRLHFKVFETDEHYQGRKGAPQEPRETIIADVTGDGKNDLILLVHDRVLVYPQG
ncbi:MAG TPA: VCBS repeat-containing protein [Opitutaceae bacterium]